MKSPKTLFLIILFNDWLKDDKTEIDVDIIIRGCGKRGK